MKLIIIIIIMILLFVYIDGTIITGDLGVNSALQEVYMHIMLTMLTMHAMYLESYGSLFQCKSMNFNAV